MSPELQANYLRFESTWTADSLNAEGILRGDSIFEDAFRRLVTMQSWRSEILVEHLKSGPLQFALEGQNDLLVSYALARTGQWRAALQSQRAALENYLNCLYFMDHSVELELWDLGKFKTHFSELLDYFSKHPRLRKFDQNHCGLPLIKQEYEVLSKAVHGSAAVFRMSSGGFPKLFIPDLASLGQWNSRNKRVVRGISLLLLALFCDELKASRKRNLRKSIALSLTPRDKTWIKKEFLVTIPF